MALVNCERHLEQSGKIQQMAIVCDPYNLLSGGGGGGVATDQINDVLYRVITTGVGYTDGDILQRVTQFDAITMVPTGTVQWLNVSTGAFIAAPLIADIVPNSDYRLLLTSEIITISNVAIGLTTIPANANYAEIQVHDANIVFTYDGVTVPSASPDIGVVQQVGALIRLQSRAEVVNFDAIRQTATDARIYVQYLQVYERQ